MRKSNKKTSIIIALIFLIGLSLLAYPTVSDQWNKLHQTRAIVSHAENVAKLSEEECETLLSAARSFNEMLPTASNRWKLSDEEMEEYNSLLISDDTEVISYLEIPKIKVSLPVYHGTGAAVLQQAIGHLEGSSLPIGGEGTHCVLSGHRGLPSAKLFTDLDQLSEGDTFLIYTLNETLTYEVDMINIVLPTDMSTLGIEPGKDLVTLFTCTPYGINTHRLVVRGRRVPYESTIEQQKTVKPVVETMPKEQLAVLVIAPVMLLLFIIILVFRKKRKGDAQ